MSFAMFSDDQLKVLKSSPYYSPENLEKLLIVYEDHKVEVPAKHDPTFEQLMYFLWARRIFTPYFNIPPHFIGEIYYEWAPYEIEDDDDFRKERYANFDELIPCRPLGYKLEKLIDFIDGIDLDKYFKNKGKTFGEPPKSRRAKSRYNQRKKEHEERVKYHNDYNNFYLQKYFGVTHPSGQLIYTTKGEFMKHLKTQSHFVLYAFMIFLYGHTKGNFKIQKFWEFIGDKARDKEESSDDDSSISSDE